MTHRGVQDGELCDELISNGFESLDAFATFPQSHFQSVPNIASGHVDDEFDQINAFEMPQWYASAMDRNAFGNEHGDFSVIETDFADQQDFLNASLPCFTANNDILFPNSNVEQHRNSPPRNIGISGTTQAHLPPYDAETRIFPYTGSNSTSWNYGSYPETFPSLTDPIQAHFQPAYPDIHDENVHSQQQMYAGFYGAVERHDQWPPQVIGDSRHQYTTVDPRRLLNGANLSSQAPIQAPAVQGSENSPAIGTLLYSGSSTMSLSPTTPSWAVHPQNFGVNVAGSAYGDCACSAASNAARQVQHQKPSGSGTPRANAELPMSARARGKRKADETSVDDRARHGSVTQNSPQSRPRSAKRPRTETAQGKTEIAASPNIGTSTQTAVPTLRRNQVDSEVISCRGSSPAYLASEVLPVSIPGPRGSTPKARHQGKRALSEAQRLDHENAVKESQGMDSNQLVERWTENVQVDGVKKAVCHWPWCQREREPMKRGYDTARHIRSIHLDDMVPCMLNPCQFKGRRDALWRHLAKRGHGLTKDQIKALMMRNVRVVTRARASNESQ